VGLLEKYRGEATVEEQNKALVRRFIGAIEKKDVAAIKEICSSDFVAHGREGNVTRTVTLAGFCINVKQGTGFSDVSYIVEEIIAKSDKVTIMYTVKAIHTGDGKKIATTGIRIERIKSRKIVEDWAVVDGLSWLRQIYPPEETIHK
jgi:predicted ester cyclase